jgi:signal transduction histidine kinase/CheY-like chemotaxis protein
MKGRSTVVSQNSIPRSAHRTWLATLAAAVLVILAGSYWYYRAEADEIRREKYRTLAAVAALKHRADTALTLREPLTLTSLPAVQAVLGKRGRFEGIDYRGVAVAAELLPIPDSPWFMVAKVDAEEIYAEARYRAADITRQLLAFARRQTIAPRVIDLNDTVAGMLKMLRRLIGEDIDLLWKPGMDLAAVNMDPSQLDQILANLAVNARDAIAGVGKITIETANATLDPEYCRSHEGFTPGRYAVLAVSDDGAGMDRQTQEMLFEPFFTTKETGKGTGLGLATVYGIVKQNGGFINVYSEPGQGTTFRIYLPRHAAGPAEADRPPAPAADPTGTETVLLVEDEPSLLRFARILLAGLGYTVLAASGPREALRLAAEHPGEIHLLLTDVVMPEMSGRDLRERLSALRPGIRSLFMSGYTTNVIAHRGVLDEGVNFMQKPFSREVLARKIRETLSI